MTIQAWYFLTLAIFFFGVAWYACNRWAEERSANKHLRFLLHQEHKKVLQYQQPKFFDFEKVNGKKEK